MEPTLKNYAKDNGEDATDDFVIDRVLLMYGYRAVVYRPPSIPFLNRTRRFMSRHSIQWTSASDICVAREECPLGLGYGGQSMEICL